MLQVASNFTPHDISSYSMYGAPEDKPDTDIDLLDSFQIGDLEVNCCVEKTTKRKLLNCSGENLYSFHNLVSNIPKSTDTVALAQVLNYLINGMDGHVITDPTDFKQKYEELYAFDITKAPHLFGLHPLCLCHQEHYDTSIIELPSIKEKTLEFYIEINQVPYKVTCVWPVETDPPVVKQEVLPPLKEDLF
jgi:hypothetical protein